MKFFSRSAAVLAAAAIFPVMVAAQEPAPQGPPPPGGRGRAGGMVQPRQVAPSGGQQLTEQQREQIRAFDEQQRTALETTHRELGDLHRQLNEALTAAQIDNGKVNSLRASIVQKETALAQARVDRLSKLSSILTAEQRQNLRGRGLGSILGPGGRGGGRGMQGPPRGMQGRGGAMAMPRGRMGGRGFVQPRQGGRGGVVGRGGVAGRGGFGAGGAIRERLNAPGGAGAGDVARLRAEIRRLEAQLNALRRRVR